MNQRSHPKLDKNKAPAFKSTDAILKRSGSELITWRSLIHF